MSNVYVYVFNTTIAVPAYSPCRIDMEKISAEQAKNLLSHGFISSVGHAGTAKVLSDLFGIEVPVNRSNTFLNSGDVAICFKLLDRIAEGKILTAAELAALKYDFWLMKYQ